MSNSTVTQIKSFSLFKERWKPNDRLVVVGHNEKNKAFFMFDLRQLKLYDEQLNSGLFAAQDPSKRAAKILLTVDPSWQASSVCWYDITVSTRPAVVNYHLVGVSSFEVPQDVQKNKTEFKLGYREFVQEEIRGLGFNAGLYDQIAQMLQNIKLQRVA